MSIAQPTSYSNVPVVLSPGFPSILLPKAKTKADGVYLYSAASGPWRSYALVDRSAYVQYVRENYSMSPREKASWEWELQPPKPSPIPEGPLKLILPIRLPYSISERFSRFAGSISKIWPKTKDAAARIAIVADNLNKHRYPGSETQCEFFSESGRTVIWKTRSSIMIADAPEDASYKKSAAQVDYVAVELFSGNVKTVSKVTGLTREEAEAQFLTYYAIRGIQGVVQGDVIFSSPEGIAYMITPRSNLGSLAALMRHHRAFLPLTLRTLAPRMIASVANLHAKGFTHNGISSDAFDVSKEAQETSVMLMGIDQLKKAGSAEEFAEDNYALGLTLQELSWKSSEPSSYDAFLREMVQGLTMASAKDRWTASQAALHHQKFLAAEQAAAKRAAEAPILAALANARALLAAAAAEQQANIAKQQAMVAAAAAPVTQGVAPSLATSAAAAAAAAPAVADLALVTPKRSSSRLARSLSSPHFVREFSDGIRSPDDVHFSPIPLPFPVPRESVTAPPSPALPEEVVEASHS